MSKPNPFAGWTPEMVAEHNRKVWAGKKLKPTSDQLSVEPNASRQVPEEASPLNHMDAEMDAAKVAMQPSTDEQKLNRTESAFWAELKARPHLWVGCQNITIKLGDDCRYTPDFCLISQDGRITFYEVKGFWRDDAKVKIKVAARQLRWAAFIVVQKSKLGFTETKVNP